LSGTDYPQSFIDKLVQTYGVTAIRIPNGQSNQFPNYVSAGVKMIYVSFSPSSTSQSPNTFASDVVSFLKANPQVTYISVAPNEPDLNGWTPAQYVPFLQAAYNSIKAARLSVIISGFEVSSDTGSGYSFVQTALSDGARGYFDVVGVHDYPGSSITNLAQFSKDLDNFHNLVNAPLVVSETNILGGGGTYFGSNPQTDTANLIATFEGKSYVQGILWYDAADNTSVWKFPLFDNSFNPVIAPYYQTAIQKYGQPLVTSADCSVTYYDSNVGNPMISAIYTDSSNKQVSSGSFQLSVVGGLTSPTTTTSSPSISSSSSQSSSSATTSSSPSSSSITTTLTSSQASSTNPHSFSSTSETRSPSPLSDSQVQPKSNSNTGILSALSPSRNSPVAYGFATYEIFLFGSLGFVFLWLRRYETPGPTWRW
jgi:hypothetical protein